MVPMEMKNLNSLKDFRNNIRRWKLDGYNCKLCKDFVSNLGHLNLVPTVACWFDCLDTQYCLISSARKTYYVCICLFGVGMGRMLQGVKWV